MFVNTENPFAYEGVTDDYDVLSLDLTEEETIQALGNRVSEAKQFWDNTLGLSNVQKENENYYLGLVTEDLFDHQKSAKDPRIFMDVEHLVALVTTNPPMPIVSEAHDTDASRELAVNLKKMLLAKWSPNELDLKQKFEKTARHLLAGKRIAIQKYRWNNEKGRIIDDEGNRKGDVDVVLLRPENVILEYGGNDDTTDIPLIAESIDSTLEELGMMYPKKKDKIMQIRGYENGVAMPLSSRVNYTEVHFTYYKNGKRGEAIAHKMGDLLLDRMKTPNWNYDEWEKDESGNIKLLNFFDRPRKPYIPYNYLNLGKYVYDDTSLIEQAASMQDNLNRRHRQIDDNLNASNSGMIFNTQMISQEDIAKITGDPNEKVGVGGDVREAAARLPVQQIDPKMIEDKYDMRREIDALFAAEAPLKGSPSGAKTLGQDVLSQRSNMTRAQPLINSLERGAIQLYGGIVQCYKVFYDVEDYERYTGSDGKTAFFMFSKDRLEDGVGISIKAGSMLPDDPLSKEDRTIKLAANLDPLSIAQGMGEDDPQEAAKRIFLFKFAPDRYAQEVLNLNYDGNTDHKAILDIKELNEGQMVPPQQNPTQSHIAQHQAFIEDDLFKTLSPEIQKSHLNHVAQETLLVKQALAGQDPQGLFGMIKQKMGFV